jgi:hypothetical protein
MGALLVRRDYYNTKSIDAMTATSGESVTDTDIAMAITVHVGAVMAVGVEVG